ncbi:hypothetical protein D3C87_1154810 [compost metagenome]
MRSTDLGFRREQISSANLHRRSAQHESRCDTACIGNPACGDHRDFHRIDNLWHQGERTHLAAQVVAEKHPAVSARFITHGDDRVTAMLFQPDGFFDGSGRRQHLGAGGFYPIEQGFFRQAKVETHHFRPKLLDDLTACVIERCAI